MSGIAYSFIASDWRNVSIHCCASFRGAGSQWDAFPGTGSLWADWVPSWVVAGFDSHEMAVIEGQNLLVGG
jgi:hypothetical protein